MKYSCERRWTRKPVVVNTSVSLPRIPPPTSAQPPWETLLAHSVKVCSLCTSPSVTEEVRFLGWATLPPPVMLGILEERCLSLLSTVLVLLSIQSRQWCSRVDPRH